jgi:uracil-DNA glycosylase family 4
MKNDFDSLKKDILQCTHCRDLFEPRPVVWGSVKSKIMQISQAPSKMVHESGKPFTDATGKRLRGWYGICEDVFYDTDNFYITGLGHCFPGKSSNRGDLTPPRFCADMWLSKEILTVNNVIYVVIGRLAARRFFPEGDFEDLVFNGGKINGKSAIILPHPSPLNMRWLKDHPAFLAKRIPEIRKTIQSTIKKV